tara:strand:+ start:20819 stop:21970 length:1152 start_codon:yes stop_codon:yes gene_type:complete
MKFNKYKISHYFTFILSGLNYFIAIILKSFIKRKNNNILLFGHKLVGNLEVIFKDKRFNQNEIFFITLNYKDYLNLKKIYGKRILTPLNIFHIFKALGCRIIVASHGIFLHKIIKKLGIKTILCGHAINGSVPKNKNKTIKNFEIFDQVWLHSPYDKKIVKNELLCKTFNLNIFGFARNQVLIENNEKKDELKERNFLNGKKVILYAPTSNRGSKKYMDSEFSLYNVDFYKFIIKELSNTNVILIIKTHLNDSISKEIKKLVKNNSNLLFQDDLDVDYDYDQLIMSDVLITDLSTIYVDYLLLGKPIYLINNPDPDPQRELSSVLKNINLPNIDNKKSLQDMIEKLKLDELKSDNIQNLKNVIYENQDHLKTIDRINKIFLSS